MNLRLILRSFESDSPFSFYFFFLFFTRIKKRGEKGGRRILYFFSFFFLSRKEKKKQGCFWRHREKLYNFSLSLSLFLFSSPSFLSPPTTTFLFSPSPLNALRRRLNSSFPPPPSRYLRLTDFFATFFHPCVFFPYPPLSFHLFSLLFSFFFTGSMFLFLFHGRRGVKPARGWLVDVSLGGRDRNHSRDGYLIFPDGYVFYSHFFPLPPPPTITVYGEWHLA